MGIEILKKYGKIVFNRGFSSAGQSACFTRRRSAVRARQSPPGQDLEPNALRVFFCLFKALKPAFYAFPVQEIFKFSLFGKKPSKTCDHIFDHRQKKTRSKCYNFRRGFLCLCGSFFELFFHLFNKLCKLFLALLARFGVYVPAYSFPVYPRRISSFVQMLIKL